MIERRDRVRLHRAMRQQSRAFACAFVELAREAKQVRGYERIRVEFAPHASTRYIPGATHHLDSIVVELPDPVATLHLDRLDAHDPAYIALNAMALHETTHLIFGSLDKAKGLYAQANGHKPTLLGISALFDICDEVSLVQGITGEAMRPLATSNSILYQRIIDIKPDERQGDFTLEIIKLIICCFVPLLDRKGDPSSASMPCGGYGQWHTSPFNDLMRRSQDKIDSLKLAGVLREIAKLQNRAVSEAECSGLDPEERTLPNAGSRTPEFWLYFEKVARDLGALFSNPPQEQEQNPEEGDDEKNEEGKPQREPQPQPQQEPGTPPPDAMAEAKNELVEDLRKESGNPQLPTDPVGAGTEDGDNRWVLRQPRKYHQHRAAMRKLIRALMHSIRFALCKPALRGSCVRDVTRIYTDARIFVRRTEVPGTNSAVAFILDCSGSTRDYADKLIAFAGCMAEGCREAGVSCASWLFGTNYRQVPARLLTRIHAPNMGGTVLHRPMEEALDWLVEHQDDEYQRKVMVILTDGKSRSPDKITEMSERALRENVTIIVGCIKTVDLRDFVVEHMPSAIPFSIGDNFGMSAVALAHRVAAVPPTEFR